MRRAAPDPSWRIRSAPIAVTLALWLAATGLWLALHYRPDPDIAHGIVAAIDAHGGGRLRALHHWAATLMLVALVLALARRWLRGLDEREDRIVWWAGLAVYIILASAFLTGRILAWDQHAWDLYHATAALLGRPAALPDDARLVTIYLVHVAALPAIAALAVPVLYRRARRERADATRVDPDTRRRSVLVASAVASVLAIGFALFFPIGHGPVPAGGAATVRPDWPFLWLVPFTLWGRTGVLAALVVATGLAVAAPWLADRMRHRDRLLALLGVLGAWAGLTLIGLG